MSDGLLALLFVVAAAVSLATSWVLVMLVGLGAPSGHATLVAAWYLGLTIVTLVCAYAGNGLRRAHVVLIICGYLAFVAAVIATT